MFLCEESLIGANWVRLYDFGKRYGLFSCYGRIKANSAGKNLNVTNTKSVPLNRKITE